MVLAAHSMARSVVVASLLALMGFPLGCSVAAERGGLTEKEGTGQGVEARNESETNPKTHHNCNENTTPTKENHERRQKADIARDSEQPRFRTTLSQTVFLRIRTQLLFAMLPFRLIRRNVSLVLLDVFVIRNNLAGKSLLLTKLYFCLAS